MKLLFALLAVTLALSACETSPMRVEYRAPPAVDPAKQQADDAAAMKRMRDRAQGNAADAL